MKSAALFAGSILCLSVGNILLKLGMDRVAALQAHGLPPLEALARAPQVPLGVVLMAAQFGGMLTLFKWGWDASVVVPLFGLNYLLTALLGRWWLAEPVGGLRAAGIVVIIVGVALVARSAPAPGP